MRVATALDALHTARLAWERSQPQLILDLWDGALDEGALRADGGSAAAPSSSASDDGVLVPGGWLGSERPSRRTIPIPPGTSAPSDGNPRGHPPDDQRFPASSLSAWGRDNGALDLSAEEVPGVARRTSTQGRDSSPAMPRVTYETSASADSHYNGPGRNTPKVSRGQGQGGESK